MNAGELVKAGKLQEALAVQLQQVKDNPADQNRRLLLFELLSFAGELDRAGRQIDALQYDNPELENTRQVYRRLIDAEQLRRKLFREGLPPLFFGDQPPHLLLRLEAVRHLGENRPAEAAEMIRQANAMTQTLTGKWNDQSFQSFRDLDDLFAGVLEVMAHGQYYWVPLEQVRGLTMKPPKFLRDLLWVPAHLELSEEAGHVFLPALYPGSHENADDRVKLGYMTDIRALAEDVALGMGQRMFFRDQEEVSILECRQLEIQPAADNPGTPPAAST